MKCTSLLIFLTFSVTILYAQKIELNTPVLATAGNGLTGETVNISKWRLGEVHLIVLNKENAKIVNERNWNVKAYPNPCEDRLYLQFDIPSTDKIFIQITDLTGRKQLLSSKHVIEPGEVINIRTSNLSSGMYLLQIIPSDEQSARFMKIQKM